MENVVRVSLVGHKLEGKVRPQRTSRGGGELAKHIVPRGDGLGQDVVSGLIQGKGEHLFQGFLACLVLLELQHGKGSIDLSLYGEQPRVGIDQHGRVVLLALRNGDRDGGVLDQVPLGHGLHHRAQGDFLRGGQRQSVCAAVLWMGRHLPQQGRAGPYLKGAGQGLGHPLALRRGP